MSFALRLTCLNFSATIHKLFIKGARLFKPSSVELCTGGGGQAFGLELAGFDHQALIDDDRHCCSTLKLNRPGWEVIEGDLNEFPASKYKGVDLVAGGMPCPPFSIAGKQLGAKDERNLFPTAIDIINEIQPNAVMIENVRGILGAVFEDFRLSFDKQLKKMGYLSDWVLLNASDFGVPQLRPRVVIYALKKKYFGTFSPDNFKRSKPATVGETLYDLMAARNWRGAQKWSERANEIAPTVVGGSKKHGGADLGPTRAKKAWATLGVDGMGIADEAPGHNFVGMPRLTVRMAARLQGFKDDWEFAGGKTASYRQVGNAFPPPVAEAVGVEILKSLASPNLFKFTGQQLKRG